MIVRDFDIERIAIGEPEADAPLIIDPNAVLSSTIAFELLQPVAGWRPKIFTGLGRIDDHERPEHGAVQVAGESAHRFAAEQPLGIPVAEALDHAGIY